MGKTLTAILTTAAAIAVNFIPVVGNTISTFLTTTIGVSEKAASAILTGLKTITASMAVSSTAALFINAPKPEATETAIKTERPARVSAYGARRLYGAYILYETDSTGAAIDVFAIHDGDMTEMLQLYLNDDAVYQFGGTVTQGADKRYQGGAVSLYWTDGSAPGAGLPAISARVPAWSGRGDGVVLLGMIARAAKSDKFIETYPNGAPTASIAAKWQRCPDPHAADPSDPAGWTWTENAIRHLLHYMLVREGVDYASKIAPTLAYWQAAADRCDAARALKGGSTEAMWRSCVAHKHTDSHAAVKGALLAACDGWLSTREDGAYIVYAGGWDAPAVTIGPDEIVAFDWDGVGVDDDTAVNDISCAYVSSAHDYGTVDTDSWTDEADITARGAVLSDSLDPQVPSHAQVRQLAKIKMARANALHRGSVTTNVLGRAVRGQRFIHLRLIEAGTTWYDGPAEITALTRNLSTGGVTFSWVAASPNWYVWNPATEEGDPAPVGERVAPEPLDAPEILTAEPEITDAATTARARLTVAGPDRDDVIWYVRWRVTTDSGWNEQPYTDEDPTPSVELLTSLLPVNVAIDLEASYGLGDGRVSPWSATYTISTSTDSLAPGKVTDASATGGAGSATIIWRNPTSSNLSAVRIYRHTANNFSLATQVGSDIVAALGASDSYTDTVAAGTYWYWITTVSASAVEGTPVALGSVVVT